MNLMKCLYLYIGCILLTLTGCTSEGFHTITSPDQDEFARVDGDKVIVNMAIDVPELADIQTRALDEKPAYQDMHLYLVEFADNGNPLQNTYITTYEPVEGSESPAVDKINYKVVLNATSKSRILHLIVLPKDQELNIDYGIEATIIPNLTTGNQTPAYWRRLEFPGGYATEDAQGNVTATRDLAQLKHVALVRNFARVAMSNKAAGFTLKGFAIVNNPESGSIAPWNSTSSSFPQFLDPTNQTQKDYTSIAAGYSGFAPEGLTLGNTDAGPVVEDDTSDKYLYERPFNSIRHTYVILKGRRDGDSEDSYYKLDIGKNDSEGVFRYYGLLRNFSYNISITNVEQKGYNTAAAAASGVVYNNFSFDIELSSMLNLSDGEEIVFVNFTTKVLTDPESQTIEFKYRYKKGDEFLNTPTFNGGPVNFIGLEAGSVIEEITYSGNDDEDGWRSVFIKCYPAQTETKTQSFIIVKPSGLGRTINLILHRKWELQNVKEFPDILENWDADTEDPGEVGAAVGSDFTIFFDLPDNLEEAMFPLVFTLESDRQNMENNPLGALVVTSGPSGFSGVQGNRIKYEKSVTWTQYNDPLKPDDPYDNGTAIDNGNGTKTHRVRCRFRTTTDLTNLPFNESVTNVLITNDNFTPATIQYHRKLED